MILLSTKFVFTTLFIAVSQAQTSAFPKGGKPSSGWHYIKAPVDVGECCINHFWQTIYIIILGMVLPNTFV
jgi:hypothetical protein